VTHINPHYHLVDKHVWSHSRPASICRATAAVFTITWHDPPPPLISSQVSGILHG